ncbi:hypothetical protein PMAYCL1PPCAC_11836 [Pristionchus mayeri]|uniref:Uncharacterized protein n=1 Tax=Pristionchus mayeri TaxID=1317129 RepID=A0AAN4ZIV3_9BILA|nr:hypothetical protein PMAYCL1PPCAC_11836 [Pristionchus mayeri]
MTSLLIRCPFCDCLPLATPEQLVSHLSHFHHHPVTVENSQFRDRLDFEIWLNRVEESRQDSSSVIAGGTREEEEGEDANSNPEYYLLCAHHSQDATKRRRVDRNGNFPLPSPVLTCPAFVHVKHGYMGQVDVAYCLDHITSSEGKRAEMPQSATSLGKKRGSSCISMDCSSSIPSTSTPMDTTVPSLMGDAVDFSPINEFISTKLDSTALKLKNLTKVLAQLAVDIGACEHRSQPVYA